MKTVIIDVKQLTKDLVAKDAEVQTCAKKLADAKESKDEQAIADLNAALDTLNGEFVELEAKVDQARDYQRRQGVISEVREMAKPVAPKPDPAGKDLEIPAVPGKPIDHDAEEKVKREAFSTFMRTGRCSGQKRELLAIKSKTLKDCAGADDQGDSVVAVPRSLVGAMVGPRIATALGIPVGGKALLATLNAVTNPSRTDFLLNPEYIAQLQQLPFAEPVWLPRVTIISTSSGTSTIFPALEQSDSATGAGEFGGVSYSWINEAAEKPETEPVFEQITITAFEVAGYTEVSQRALNRSEIALESFLRAIFAATFEYEMDRVIINGTGVGQPTGIIPAAGVRAVARAAAGGVSHQDYVNLKHAVRSYHRSGARIVMHDDVEASNEGTLDGDGQPLFKASASAGPNDRVNGIPYEASYNCPDIGTTGDVIYGNPAWYTLVMEEEFGIARSEHYKFRNDLVAFRMYAVVGGRPMQPRAFSILSDADS